MKKILLLTIMGVFLVSCGGGGWSDEDKNYLRSEIKSEVYDEFTDFENGYTMLEEFCNCILDAAMDEWSSLDDMDNDSYSDGYDWGFEQAQKCADKVGFEFGGWSESDKSEFKSLMRQEIVGTPLYDEADAFCNCILDAAMDEWSSLDDMENDSYSDGYDWGFEQGMKCAEKLGFEI